MNIVSVKIDDFEYTLKGIEEPQYINKVAEYVDEKVKVIKEKNAKLGTSNAAILAAINVVDDLFKFHIEYEKLEDKLKAKEEEFNKVLEKYNNIMRENLEIIEQNSKLKEEIKILEEKKISIEKEKEIEKFKITIEDLQKENKQLKEEKNISRERLDKFKTHNKDTKFDLQTYKYKVLELEKKLQENQISLAKVKLEQEPLKKRKYK